MQELVITQTIGGVIHIHLDWPSYLKRKGVYFVKKDQEGIYYKWASVKMTL